MECGSCCFLSLVCVTIKQWPYDIDKQMVLNQEFK
jgi:hypothetical protein